jgi:hypothetical protein
VVAAAYTYPALVKGKYSEINTGKFDLVDGIANDTNGGAVVYVTEKQIARDTRILLVPSRIFRANCVLPHIAIIVPTIPSDDNSDIGRAIENRTQLNPDRAKRGP